MSQIFVFMVWTLAHGVTVIRLPHSALDQTPIVEAQLWIETEHLADEIDDFCNIVVTLPAGQKYGLNVWSFGFFESAVAEGEINASPEAAELYMHPPDLFVKDLTRPTLEAVVADLLVQGRLPERCRIAD
jgi:hypothetical protein